MEYDEPEYIKVIGKLGGRKHLAYWGLVIISTLLLALTSKLTGDQWVNMNIFLFGLYTGTSLGTKAINAWKGRNGNNS